METRAGDLDQVVAMLLRSREEARSTLVRVEGALVALGVDLDDVELAQPTPELHNRWNQLIHTHEGIPRPSALRPLAVDQGAPQVDTSEPRTAVRERPVRKLVMEILDQRHAWMTNAEVADIVMKQVGGDRPEEKIKSNVRSSLWSLRQKGEVVERDGKNMATKWLTDTDAAPADAETASDSAPETQEGGEANGTDAHGVRG